ncbi:MAG: hypothetical protein K0R66_104 [Gammaproteobacteria bacterium]|jgi:hypothetical protein|nr:hypothetical protein [Gammaproteobacteria bacterium]
MRAIRKANELTVYASDQKEYGELISTVSGIYSMLSKADREVMEGCQFKWQKVDEENSIYITAKKDWLGRALPGIDQFLDVMRHNGYHIDVTELTSKCSNMLQGIFSIAVKKDAAQPLLNDKLESKYCDGPK